LPSRDSLRPRRGSPFTYLWLSSTVALFGDQVAQLCLPLIAAVTLQASPVEMGLLRAAPFLPEVGLGLIAGAWADRLPRRQVMVVADWSRVPLLLCVPLAWLLGGLSVPLLFLVAMGTGVFASFFEAAATAILPTLVEPERLPAANGRLQLSASLAQLMGPLLAGGLVGIVTAPLAMVVPALALVASGTLLTNLPKHAPPARTDRHLLAEVREGVAALTTDPVLRLLALAWGLFLVTGNAVQSLYVLYITSWA
jgi:hypothetical protein